MHASSSLARKTIPVDSLIIDSIYLWTMASCNHTVFSFRVCVPHIDSSPLTKSSFALMLLEDYATGVMATFHMENVTHLIRNFIVIFHKETHEVEWGWLSFLFTLWMYFLLMYNLTLQPS